MTITVDITPEVQAELARLAACRGEPVEDYAARLIEEAVHLPTPPQNKSLKEVFETVRGLADDADFSHNPSTARPIDLSRTDICSTPLLLRRPPTLRAMPLPARCG
jgi:hypothetical protein